MLATVIGGPSWRSESISTDADVARVGGIESWSRRWGVASACIAPNNIPYCTVQFVKSPVHLLPEGGGGVVY